MVRCRYSAVTSRAPTRSGNTYPSETVTVYTERRIASVDSSAGTLPVELVTAP